MKRATHSVKKEQAKQQSADQKEIIEKQTKPKPPRIMPFEEKRQLLRDIQERVRRKALKQVIKQREASTNGKVQPVRVQFMPSELLDTGVFVHKTAEYVQLSLKPLYEGRETLAINTYPCPAQTCEFQVQIQGAARLGLVSCNMLKKVLIRHSVTLNSLTGKLWVGNTRHIVGRIDVGSKVRLMVCVATRKFRVYVDDTKKITCDFPIQFKPYGNVYFFVDLLGSGCIKIK